MGLWKKLGKALGQSAFPDPAGWEDDPFTTVQDKRKVDDAFRKMKERVYAALEGLDRVVYRESGKLSPGVPYFYIKPLGEPGFLFEREDDGWVVVQAEKMVGEDTFLRGTLPKERATLVVNQKGLSRVNSPLLNAEKLSLSLYEQRLIKALRLTDDV